jgi:hypothetical protein
VIGPEGVGLLIAGVLSDTIVAEVDALAAELGPLADGTGTDPDEALAPVSLVAPQLISPAPPDDVTVVPVDQWPFLAVSVRATPRIVLIDTDPYLGAPGGPISGDVYDCDYTARIYTWVRGDGYTQTKAIRDRLMLAVRQVLLRNQASTSARLVADRGGSALTEDFAPIGVDAQLQQTIGAGWTQGVWRVQETLGQPAIDPSPTQTVVTVSLAGR